MKLLALDNFCNNESTQISVVNQEEYILDLSKDYPPIDFLLEHKGIGCIPRGDIQGVAGKQKAGKTFALTVIVTALLKGEYMEFKATRNDLKILYIDTEQATANVVKKIKTIHSLSGWSEKDNNERLQVLCLRQYSYIERQNIVFEKIEAFGPDAVVIDGLRDLCEDFNNIGESAALVGKLMQISSQYNTALINVLHENKSRTDTNMKGHLGTELANKVSETYKVSSKKDDKNSPVITVEQEYCRNRPIDKWSFTINSDGIPVMVDVEDINATRDKRDKAFIKVFSKYEKLSYKDLVENLEIVYHCKESMAKKLIREAKIDGVINQDDKKQYYLSNENKVLLEK